ncbi:MAG: hypothetical protein ACOC1X_02125 [Promethearchaeota archaeon]
MEQEDIELIENALATVVKTYDVSREEVLAYMERKWVKPSIEDGESEGEAWLTAINNLLLYFFPPNLKAIGNKEIKNRILRGWKQARAQALEDFKTFKPNSWNSNNLKSNKQ